MKVLFIIRSDAVTKPGGDTVQLHKTKEALELLGVQVRLGTGQEEDLKWSDVVHVFNAQTPEISLPCLTNARKLNKKTVLSTIWWDLGHAQQASYLYERSGPPAGWWRWSLPVYRAMKSMADRQRHREISALLRLPHLLLPNSEEEMFHLKKTFGIDLPDYRIVMNAVDTKIFNSSEPLSERGVICCARLEATKNQIALIKAVAAIPGETLTLVGRAGNSKKYASDVRDLASEYGFALIEDHLSQHEVAALMQKHHIHALPSFRESPGLSSLEALAMGLNLVVAGREFCPVDTYFEKFIGRQVFLSDPYSVNSIKTAIVKASMETQSHNTGFPQEMTWSSVAQQTLAAYESL